MRGRTKCQSRGLGPFASCRGSPVTSKVNHLYDVPGVKIVGLLYAVVPGLHHVTKLLVIANQ